MSTNRKLAKRRRNDGLHYSPDLVDKLARELCETVVARPGVSIPYDVEAYDRVSDHSSRPHLYNPRPIRTRKLTSTIPDNRLAAEKYLLRIGGYRRDAHCSPDCAAKTLKDAGIGYADSLGNGLFEHLLLCRKYGIVPTFEAPALQIPLPFLPEEFPAFRQLYRGRLLEMRKWIERAEVVYGQPILNRDRQPWVVWCPLSPLALFLMSAQRKPARTAEALYEACGCPRLQAAPRTAKDQLAQFKAASFIRRQHAQVLKTMSEEVREAIAPRGLIIGNMHTLPPIDYEAMHEVFDHPGVAVRPGYVAEVHLRDPYVAYAVRLFADLIDRPPIVSIRANLTAAGTKYIAGKQAICRWFDESLRQGVAGFYLWPVDYPIRSSDYRGAMPGNPHPGAFGPQRWEAMLDNLRSISTCRRFTPPAAEVGILVPYDAMGTPEWRRVLCTFTELQAARIQSQLLSGRAAERDLGSIQRFRALVIPALPFVSDRLTENLRTYVRAGGTAIVPQSPIGELDMAGDRREPLFELEVDKPRTIETIQSGSGRIVLLHPPAGGGVIDRGDRHSQRSRAANQWRRIAAKLQLTSRSWVFHVTGRDLAQVGAAVESVESAPEPQLTLPHYLYEHSSDWILPYLEHPTEFPSELLSGSKGR